MLNLTKTKFVRLSFWKTWGLYLHWSHWSIQNISNTVLSINCMSKTIAGNVSRQVAHRKHVLNFFFLISIFLKDSVFLIENHDNLWVSVELFLKHPELVIHFSIYWPSREFKIFNPYYTWSAHNGSVSKWKEAALLFRAQFW